MQHQGLEIKKKSRHRQFIYLFRASVAEHTEAWFYLGVSILYLLGVWEHLPFSGGHIYSDIVSVYQNRFCYSGTCTAGLPYVNNFVEYPVITGFFMYSMGLLGRFFPLPGRDLIGNYYTYTSIFLLIPTLLVVHNILKISEILRIGRKFRRSFFYLVATPSFIFMLLLNWYIIGVFFAIFGLRKFLEGEGSRWWSGALFGLSAASNLITAVPALGILSFGSGSWKERMKFGIGMFGAIFATYVPVIIINSFPHSYMDASHNIVQYSFAFPNLNVVSDFLAYEHNWYIEGSWMLALFTNTSPIRYYIFPALFVALSMTIIWRGARMNRSLTTKLDRARMTVTMCSLFTFAFLFSTYVCTPQMNLILLPFFVLLPTAKYYPEFLAFEVVNALVIVWGFSAPLLFLGINISTPAQFGPIWVSPIQFLAVLRSLWIGKFLIIDGLLRPRNFPTGLPKKRKLDVVIPGLTSSV